jgi:hypothetical protein
MPKIVPIKESIDDTRAQAAAENWFKTIVMESDDLNAELRDVKTVVDVAIETLTEADESSVAVGALRMIEYKLTLIERSAQNIFESARIPKLPPISKKGRP